MLSNGDGSSPCDCAGWEHAPAGATNGPVCHLPEGCVQSNANYLVKSAQEFPDDKYTVTIGSPKTGVMFHLGDGMPMNFDKLAQRVIRPVVEAIRIRLVWLAWVPAW